MTVHVYHGPTIGADTVLGVLPGARLHPPVKHGDLLRLDTGPDDTVVIIDGLFHSTGAVRHKEILELLARGVRVVGASSMGALRASELHPYGMVGVGWIFRAYRDGVIEADDEVAVAHTSDDFVQVCEPLVNIRYTLDAAAGDGVIQESSAAALLEAARALPYTTRGWTMLRRTAAANHPELADEVSQLMDWHGCRSLAMNIKLQDALEALRIVAADGFAAPDTSGWAGGTWRNFFIHYWTARFHGTTFEGNHVPFLAELQHQQLYDPDFPRRWRLFTLRWIAGDQEEASPDEMEARALAATIASGITIPHLGTERLGSWLTPAELVQLDDREKLLRILIRADWSTTIWPSDHADARGLMNPDIPSAAIANSSFRFNRQVAAEGPNRTIHHLRTERIRAHLARVWEVPEEDTDALAAAARDRAFDSFDRAVESARAFYLWAAQRDRVPAAARAGS